MKFREFLNEVDFYTEHNLQRFLSNYDDSRVKVEKNGKRIVVYRFNEPSLVMDIKNNVITFNSDDFHNIKNIKTDKLSSGEMEVVIQRNIKNASNENIKSSDYKDNYLSLSIRD